MANKSKAIANELKAITDGSKAIADDSKAIADDSKADLSSTGLLSGLRRIAPVADDVPDAFFAPTRDALFERNAIRFET
ncbi:MAG: hypothetical protein LBP19_02095 [Treponema sp.]|jgi:hypothetical protein|nr:hypothetical protein [Treponema sp.]